ncbi:hypothetical protein SLS60_003613 [Paraconiothyrium brasiliense]|uniref:Uncharacterized protein n=1 Tax=Paraconiothyrium brasiliense TaxID=300254 RepID=A0ABR3RP38_9PLEO
MAKNPPDERLVYLALKRVFQGSNAELRQKKKVLKLIQQHQDEVDVRSLIQEHSIDSLCNVSKCLLEERIFESTLKAKIRFPEVFDVSPAQTAERAISQSEAAKNEDAAIEQVMEGQKDKAAVQESKVAETQSEATGSQSLQLPSAAISLYPVYLPFDVQHRLLVGVQQKLEQACYAFAQEKLSGVLQREGWDCAEAVELNRWPKIILTYQEELRLNDSRDLTRPLTDLLNSIAQLRHAAVHRLRLTADRVLQFVIDAELLVTLLRNDDFLFSISTTRRQIQSTIEELERNKDMLELRQVEIKKRFAAKRAELDLEEREAIHSMVKEDKDYTFFAGMNLEQALHAPATVIHRRASTGGGSSSETDFDECSTDEAIANLECVD